MEDEQVRRALDRGCDRDAVMDVLDVSQRSTFDTVKRACAYEFPLDAFGRGGRPAADARSQDAESTSASDAETQQRLDDVSDDGDAGRTETRGGDTTGESLDTDTATPLSELASADASSESGDELQQEIDAAIKTLEALQGGVE